MLKMGLGLNKSQHSFNLRSIPGLQLLALPNRDLATGWTSDNKVVQDFSEGGKRYGNDLLAGWDFTSGWGSAGGLTSKTENSFTTTSGGGVIKSYSMSASKKYRFVLKGSSSATSFKVRDGAAGIGVTVTPVAGIFDIVAEVSWAGAADGNIYIANSGAGVTSFTSLEVKEITNGNHGIYKNSMELNQVAGRTYYTFDGTDDYIDFGTDISLIDNFSISVLFKTTDNELTLASKYDYGANQKGLWLVVFENKIQLYESDNGVNDYRRIIDNPTVHNAGSVNFVTLTKSGTALKAYVNGAEKVVTFLGSTTVASLHPSTAPLLSGARLNSGVPNYFGSWDKGLLIINSGILTLQQHKQIYNSPEVQSIIAGM